MFPPKTYNDRWVRITGSLLWAHFIRSLGGPGALLEDLATAAYYVEVLAGAAITFVLWTLIRAVSRRLDGRYGWLEQPWPRIFWQTALGVALPSVLAFFAMLLFFRFIVRYDIFQTPWLHYEYPVSVLFLLALNGYYAGYNFYNRLSAPRPSDVTDPGRTSSAAFLTKKQTAAPPALRSLIVTKGSRNIPVPVEEVAYFFIRDEQIFLKTFDDQTYRTDQTLDEWSAQLSGPSFFRASRQTLVHVRACTAYRSIENDKLELTLQPPPAEPVVVSQKKARAFREWLAGR